MTDEPVVQTPLFTLKTICAEYGRKLNPELIIPRRTYESIQEAVTLWADVSPDQDPNEAIKALQLLAEERVAERLQDKVRRLREQRDNNGTAPLLAIETAFRVSYSETTGDEYYSEPTDTAWTRFKTHLDQAAANLAAQ